MTVIIKVGRREQHQKNTQFIFFILFLLCFQFLTKRSQSYLDTVLFLLRQVYEQAFTKFTSLRAFKEFQRFRVNACIDSTKGKNKLRNYYTELVDYILKGKSKYNYCLRIEKGRRHSQVRDKGT